MPVYDYACETCGVFTALRPMAEYALPLDCPDCGRAAPRALLQVPGIAVMASGQRRAHAVNERSAHAPRLASAGGAHRPGCACCKPAGKTGGPAAVKGFPSQRPWMISH
jgi:putative FmdB family regulatory protein